MEDPIIGAAGFGWNQEPTVEQPDKPESSSVAVKAENSRREGSKRIKDSLS
jgi:hypothetical protein